MYKRTIWQDHVEGIQEGTDMNAANFNNLEAGTMEANALAAFNAEFRRYDHDIAKNNEVVSFSKELYDQDSGDVLQIQYIAIPDSVTRNNGSYTVVPQVTGLNGDTVPLIIVKEKQANGFNVEIRGSANFLSVCFLLSGGIV